ncbi:MAG: tetratricopeptide repeat protein, partial [Bradymonadaceae bacterium]
GFSIDLLEEALDEAPPNWSIASRLAQQYAVQARQQEAERVLDQYIERSSSTPDALKHAARWARERRNYDLAKHYYERLLEVDPKRPDVWMELGKLYAELGQIEKMKHALDTFVEQHGDDRHDMLDVASIYSDQKLYEEAEKVIKRVRENNPKSLLV